MPHIAHPLSTGNETTTECQFFRDSGALGSLSPGNQDELSSFGQVQSKNPWHLVGSEGKQPLSLGIFCSINRPSLPAVRASAHPWWAVHAIQAWEELIIAGVLKWESSKWVCLKIVYPYTQWLMIIIPTKWL